MSSGVEAVYFMNLLNDNEDRRTNKPGGYREDDFYENYIWYAEQVYKSH